MAGFLIRRLAGLVPLLFMVSLGVFALVYLVPGDPARQLAGGENATEERVDEVRKSLGLDDPLLVQYGKWVGAAVRLDFGESLFTERSVTTELSSRLPVTGSIVLGSASLAVVVSLIAGVAAALRPRSLLDKAIVAGTSAGMAMPTFWLALILVSVFAVEYQWFPAIGFVRFSESPFEWAKHLVLPCVSIGIGMSAALSRQLRGALADVLDADYIRTARSKGLAPTRVVGKHALKNASMPAITVLGLQVGYLFGGAIIIEQIFAIPGIGALMITAVINQDVPVVQGGVMLMAVLVMITNLVVDILYGYVNPKVRLA